MFAPSLAMHPVFTKFRDSGRTSPTGRRLFSSKPVDVMGYEWTGRKPTVIAYFTPRGLKPSDAKREFERFCTGIGLTLTVVQEVSGKDDIDRPLAYELVGDARAIVKAIAHEAVQSYHHALACSVPMGMARPHLNAPIPASLSPTVANRIRAMRRGPVERESREERERIAKLPDGERRVIAHRDNRTMKATLPVTAEPLPAGQAGMVKHATEQRRAERAKRAKHSLTHRLKHATQHQPTTAATGR